MNLAEFRSYLLAAPDAVVRVRLPDGSLVPAHAHVTEVARVDKRFVDCGGTAREERACRLQVWVADDIAHRLTAGKLARILDLAAPILGDGVLAVDIEYEAPVITQFPVASATTSTDGIVFGLETRRTACLAEDRCIPNLAPAAAGIRFVNRVPAASKTSL